MELTEQFEALTENLDDSELEVSEVRDNGDRVTHWYFI